MTFKNRQEAADQLVQRLQAYQDKNPLVLAIPRGAIHMAKRLAEGLQGDLDVVLVHKLGAPGQPELAIGAVDETGEVYLHPYAKLIGVGQSYLEQEIQNQVSLLRVRRKNYTPLRQSINPQGRIVIVVDDGIATGATMIAALNALRKKNPKKIIVATAVAPASTVEKLENFADEVVCLEAPEDFRAVGQFFEDFSQVSDEEVIQALRSRK
ncbi:MAG: phosphoribosyltransferase [Deltaproteobacteria bacterium]|nr:phosphoribosyltransferase [Deltaproteobacteria bacterium]